MKRKLLYTAIVATVMGTANPVYAQSGQIMYTYVYKENGQEVGQAFDICHPHGQFIERQLFGATQRSISM